MIGGGGARGGSKKRTHTWFDAKRCIGCEKKCNLNTICQVYNKKKRWSQAIHKKSAKYFDHICLHVREKLRLLHSEEKLATKDYDWGLTKKMGQNLSYLNYEEKERLGEGSKLKYYDYYLLLYVL